MENYFDMLFSKFGYFAIGVGTFFEGEIILILAALMATRGHVQLEWVIVAAAGGAFLGDVALYLIGSWKVDYLIEKIPGIKKYYPRAQHFFRKFGVVSILAARFLYGMRVPTGVIAGMSNIRLLRFVSVALVGCTLWAVAWSVLAYSLGQTISGFFSEFQKYQSYFLLTVVVALPIFFVVRKMIVKA
jgi:membrane protein DedA with SNARE-associated domain